jgi:hypothetical protein
MIIEETLIINHVDHLMFTKFIMAGSSRIHGSASLVTGTTSQMLPFYLNIQRTRFAL